MPKGFIEGSITCSESGCRFVEQHGLDLVSFTADRLNEQLFTRFHRELQLALDPDKDPAELKTVNNHPQLRYNRVAGDKVRGELMLNRYMDSYLTYLSELLREVFLARPETLRSGEQIEISQVLGFSTIPELVSHIAERKITQLSYSGLADISNFFEARLGLRLIDDAELMTRMQEWVALRNLYTHRRGVVDERAHKAGLGNRYRLGERAVFSRDDGIDAMIGIFSAMQSIDERTAKKFGLRTRSVTAMAPFDSKFMGECSSPDENSTEPGTH